MTLLKTYITDFINNNIMPLGVTVIGIALIMVAFALILGTQRMKEWAKGHIFEIIIGELFYIRQPSGRRILRLLSSFKSSCKRR